MICVKCDKEIQVRASYRILALDRPFINLYFHPDCYPVGELAQTEFLATNRARIVQYIQREVERPNNFSRTGSKR